MKDRVVLPPFPPFYCARIAPLPVPMFEHLCVLAYREEEKVAKRRRLSPEQIWNNIEKEVREARNIVYDYMDLFVEAEIKRGAENAFLTSSWLLDALKSYNPKGEKNSIAMLNNWQQKGVPRRSKFRGHYDPTSVAAILIARVVVRTLGRNILPLNILPDEPHWWCFSQTSPDANVCCTPIPLPADLPPATILWTPWIGASWYAKDWFVYGDGAARWADPTSSVQILAVWGDTQAKGIEDIQNREWWFDQSVAEAARQKVNQGLLENLARDRIRAINCIQLP